MRNFDGLSAHNFEMLVRDLMSAELDTRFEAFSPGPDGGVDLRGEGPTGTIIIQCKHYRRSRPFDLKRAAAREAKALATHSPDRYILATTASMTPALKSELVDILRPHVKASSDILGPEDIDGLLTRHPNVEKATPKLWMTSGTVLQRLLASATVNRTSLAIARMNETMKVYVPTPSLTEGRSALQRDMCCIIQGPAGIGKTTLAYVLAAEAIAEGYEPIFISSDVDEALSLVADGDDRHVVVYDDFLGQSTMAELLGKNEDARLADLVQLAVGSRRVKLIATTRDYILKHALRKYDRLNQTITDARSIVITVEDFKPMVRAEVLYNHLYYSSLPDQVLYSFQDTEKVLKIITHTNYSPRLVAGFSALPMASDPSTNGPTLLLSHLDDPIQLWGSVLNQLQPECGDILTVLLTLPNPSDVNDLAVATRSFRRQKGRTLETSDFIDALRALEPTFVNLDGNEYSKTPGSSFVNFTNPSIQDLALLRLGDLLAQDITDLLASLVYWEQVAMLGGLAFAPDNQPEAAARSLAYRGRPDLLRRVVQSLQFLAGDTNGFVRAISRTLFVPSPRSQWDFKRQPLGERMSLVMTWPRTIRDGLLRVDPGLGEKIKREFTAITDSERDGSLTRLLGTLERHAENPQLQLLEPSLRDAAVELLSSAEASTADQPTSASWWEKLAWKQETRWLVTAARVSTLYEFDENFRERLAKMSTKIASRLLARIEAIVGYTRASAKITVMRRNERESNPEDVDHEMVRDAAWSRYMYSYDEGVGIVRDLRSIFDSISPAMAEDTAPIPYLPNQEMLGEAISDVRSLLPFVQGTLAQDHGETLAIAEAIVRAEEFLSRLLERGYSATSSGWAERGSWQSESDVSGLVANMFRNLGADDQ